MSSIKKIQKEWYEVLKNQGFNDIEDTTRILNGHHPLRAWTGINLHIPIESEDDSIHSILDQIAYQEPLKPITTSFPEPHLCQEQDFFNSDEFEEICESICSDKRRVVNKSIIVEIFKYHLDGFSSRDIESLINIDHMTVWRIISLLTKWAKYE